MTGTYFGMVILDTHTWFWWVASPELLSQSHRLYLERTKEPFAVSTISLWEISLLESKGRIELPLTLQEWFGLALEESGVQEVSISRPILIESNRLPGDFHRDPADRLIVATSRILGAPILTSDKKIKDYAHVLKVGN